MVKGNRSGTGEQGAMEIVEEATHVLRGLPPRLFAGYYAGTLPFVLGLLYFLTDMGRGIDADERLVGSAVVLSLLFIWMKYRHAIFCSDVRAHVAGETSPERTLKDRMRILVGQTAVQPTGFIVLPIASLILLPLGYAFAFYQEFSVVRSGEQGLWDEVRAAAHQARIFPRQNHFALLLLSFFWIFVVLNVMTAIIFATFIVKAYFGIETVFTRLGLHIMNTTLLTCSMTIAYAVVDPIIKTLYVLRRFHGESIRTGEDIKAALAGALSRKAGTAAALIIAASLFSTCLPAEAAPAVQNRPQAAASYGASDLDRSIKEVISHRKYRWRLPRERKATETEKPVGFVGRMLDYVLGGLKKSCVWVSDKVRWVCEKLGGRRPRPAAGRGGLISTSPDTLLFVVMAIVISLLGVFLYRVISKRKARPVALGGSVVEAAPDLTEEDLSAEELPANGWLLLAREMFAKGETRLALRALYLAGLAHLSDQGLVSLAPYKSNREYEGELRTRAHTIPSLIEAFSSNVMLFESVWYGAHAVTDDLLGSFSSNQKEVMRVEKS